MQIRLTGEASRHLVLDKSMLEDPRLSFRAKGLLAYLLAHPGFDLSNKRLLTSISLEGVDAVGTALKELEEAGYFRQAQEANEDGSIQTIGVVSPVSRIPLLESQHFDKPIIPNNEEIEPSDVPPHQEKPVTPAQRVIDQLNEFRKKAWDWARYTPISAKYAKNVEHINGRLADWTDTPTQRHFAIDGEIDPLEVVIAAVDIAGQVEAEAVDFDGKPIDGFGRKDAVPVVGDSLDHDVLWRKSGESYDLGALPADLRDKPVRLRFWMRQARIFALRSEQNQV